MPMNPAKAQDVWKTLVVRSIHCIELNHRTRKEQEAIQNTVDRYQAIIRSLRIRDNKEPQGLTGL